MSNRVLETVTGYEAAKREIANCVSRWNESNADGRMTISKSGLLATDQEGSGEFFKAVCMNANEAANDAAEVYEIQTCW